MGACAIHCCPFLMLKMGEPLLTPPATFYGHIKTHYR